MAKNKQNRRADSGAKIKCASAIGGPVQSAIASLLNITLTRVHNEQDPLEVGGAKIKRADDIEGLVKSPIASQSNFQTKAQNCGNP